MSLQAFAASPSATSQILILQSRAQYTHCHIRVPEVEQALPAIAVHHQYYSFFKVVTREQEALATAQKLSLKGDSPMVTKVPKGYAIWIGEPDATLN
jgi:hypothetical protein